MVLLDLLHIQRAGYFRFLKLGISKELSQLNINIENTRLQILPFDNPNTFNGLALEKSNKQPFLACAKQGQEGAMLFRITAGAEQPQSESPSHLTPSESLLSGIASQEKKAAKDVKHPSRLNQAKIQQKTTVLNLARMVVQPQKSKMKHETTKDTCSDPSPNGAKKNMENNNLCFRLIAPKYTPREAISYQKSWNCKLVVKVRLTIFTKKTDALGDMSVQHEKVHLSTRPNVLDMEKKTLPLPMLLIASHWRKAMMPHKTISLATHATHEVMLVKESKGVVACDATSLQEGQGKGNQLALATPLATPLATKTFGNKATPLAKEDLEALTAKPSEIATKNTVIDFFFTNRGNRNFLNFKKRYPTLSYLNLNKGPQVSLKHICYSSVACDTTSLQESKGEKVTFSQESKQQKSKRFVLLCTPSQRFSFVVESARRYRAKNTLLSRPRNGSLTTAKPIDVYNFINNLGLKCTTISFQSKNQIDPIYTMNLPAILPSPCEAAIKKSSAFTLEKPGQKKQSFTLSTLNQQVTKVINPLFTRLTPFSKQKFLGKNNCLTDFISQKGDRIIRKKANQKPILWQNISAEHVKPNEIRHELFLVLGELPLMTKRGNFIINGSPRTVLSQLIRTPGIYFTERDNSLQADCIPEQGPWLCIYKSENTLETNDFDGTSSSKTREVAEVMPSRLITSGETGINKPWSTKVLSETAPSLLGTKTITRNVSSSNQLARNEETNQVQEQSKSSFPEPNKLAQQRDKLKTSQAKQEFSSYFCYTKQFSSIPFAIVYSNFRTFELHSQFTDQTLLLTKLKTLEKIRQLRETISTLLTFTYKKRIRKRLRKLYAKRCFLATQQFEKTKVLFRLKKKLDLGFLGRKSFYEKLGMSSCTHSWGIQNSYKVPYYSELPCLYTAKSSLMINGSNLLCDSSSEDKDPAFFLVACEAKGITCYSANQESVASPTSLRVSPLKTKGKASANPSLAMQKKQTNPFIEPQDKGFGLADGKLVSTENIKSSLTFTHFNTTLGTMQSKPYPVLPSFFSLTEGNSIATSCVACEAGDGYDATSLQEGKATDPWPKVVNVLQRNFTGGEGSTLNSQDLAFIVNFLNSDKAMAQDDIDDLNNQRVRTPDSQVQQQLRIGCLRFRKMFIKLVKESWGVSQTMTDLLNGALREFFGSNPLSQFLDQTNPLAEITHKRRISKLGIGGIQRESATLKVRTIHSTYFGRICPIETPEGLNAGLVNSLTCLSRVNTQGQLVTPLSPLIRRQMQNHFYFYSNKEKQAISTVDTALLKFQRLPNQFIYTKNSVSTVSEFQQLEWNAVNLRVQSDLQTISLATALIPFLAYDDANRALMGSNMQRQAVPLISPERPIIRTGLESLVINQSGYCFESPRAGFISYVSAQFVRVQTNIVNKRTPSLVGTK